MNFTPVAKRLMAKRIKKLETAAQSPVETQVRQLRWLLFHGANSKFGKEADFESVLHLGDPRLAFSRLIPARDYETLRPYAMRMLRGEKDVLWPGYCESFAISSGTSGGRSKIIPITDHALRLNHYDGASDVVAFYLAANPASRLFAGKGLILGGSFEKPLPCSSITARAGDLSATLIDRIPGAASLFRTPSKETALMSDWSEKLDRIAREAAAERVTNLSGVPSWMLKVLERSLDISGKDSLAELWPDLETFFYGGISFLPYRGEYSRICGDKKLIFFPTYNASEGFFASASHLQRPGSADREEMTLLLDATIYYEFYPVGHTEPDGPLESDPVMIEDLKVGDTYELVITAPNGLYRYRLGDCVTVTDTAPLTIHIAGRTKSEINAFGEEVMEHHANGATEEACRLTGASVENYTVAPIFAADGRKGRHQWLIEWSTPPDSMEKFARVLDESLRRLCCDYDAKRQGDIFLDAPEITVAEQGAFDRWLQSVGNRRLGGQRKVPRLSSTRKIIDEII